MLNRTLVVVDTETGGLIPTEHSLLTVAFLIVQDMSLVAKREWKIKHKTWNVTTGALGINGINLVEFEKEALDGITVASEMISFLRQYCTEENRGILVGQNTVFDRDFIRFFLERTYGVCDGLTYFQWFDKIIDRRYIDLMSITAFMNLASMIDTDGLGLDKVIEVLGIPMEGRHTALGDAISVYEALSTMISKVSEGTTVSK